MQLDIGSGKVPALQSPQVTCAAIQKKYELYRDWHPTDDSGYGTDVHVIRYRNIVFGVAWIMRMLQFNRGKTFVVSTTTINVVFGNTYPS